MAKKFTNEHKFYLTDGQTAALNAYAAHTGHTKASIAREAVMGRIAMSQGNCAVCADGRECIAPLVRLQKIQLPQTEDLTA